MQAPHLLDLVSPTSVSSANQPALITGQTLFCALVRAIRDKRESDIERAHDEVSRKFREFWNKRLSDRPGELDNARALIACALQATTNTRDFLTRPTERNARAAAPARRTWLWTRALLAAVGLLTVKTVHRVRVPIAFREAETTKGSLATLDLSILEGGRGAVAHDPRDTFNTLCLRDFTETIEGAWVYAGGQNTEFDGLWRLLPFEARNFAATGDGEIAYSGRTVKGRSAGAAALRGWSLARGRMFEDPGIIFMFGMTATGEPESVDGIAEKVSAVADDDWFDKIAVASDNRHPTLNNYTEAVAAVRDCKAAARIKVVAY